MSDTLQPPVCNVCNSLHQFQAGSLSCLVCAAAISFPFLPELWSVQGLIPLAGFPSACFSCVFSRNTEKENPEASQKCLYIWERGGKVGTLTKGKMWISAVEGWDLEIMWLKCGLMRKLCTFHVHCSPHGLFAAAFFLVFCTSRLHLFTFDEVIALLCLLLW